MIALHRLQCEKANLINLKQYVTRVTKPWD